MKPCAMAGYPCLREAVLTARIAGIGDRAVCRECYETMDRLGMAVRELGADTFTPRWRERDLTRDMSRVA